LNPLFVKDDILKYGEGLLMKDFPERNVRNIEDEVISGSPN